jgi:superfamily II DNA or RNA helicase
MIAIRQLDHIHCKVNAKYSTLLLECLSYKTFSYFTTKKKRKKIKKEKLIRLIDRDGLFYTGHLHIVRRFLSAENYDYRIFDLSEILLPDNRPYLKGKTLRDDQTKLIDSLLKRGRGVIQAPMGTGKTLIAGAIFSCFKRRKKLFLVHTNDLLRQASSDFKQYGFKNISTITEGKIDLSGEIVVATRQSFIKIDPNIYADMFDIVVVDEVHHISSIESEYFQILTKLLAPVRVGITATFPKEKSSILAIEGAIGRLVGVFPIKEAIEKGILAKPFIKIFKLPLDREVREIKKWADAYQVGVVENDYLNQLTVDLAQEYVDKNKSVLIYVDKIKHGENIVNEATKIGLPIYFVRGATDSSTREKIKKMMIDKKIKCVVATVVWKEGINIPSLNVIINAVGGKSEIAVLQLIGRVLRRTEKKTTAIIIDFFNPSNRFFIDHFGHRISLYCELGWIGEEE